MRIVKRSVNEDQKTNTVFEAFDTILRKMPYPWKMNAMEFTIGSMNSVFVNDEKATISMDYNDSFVQENDKKGIISMILHSLYHIIIRDRYSIQDIPHFIEDILINREMINDGYEDYVFYASYLYLLRKRYVSSLEEYLKINIPWLSFYKKDNYNTESLKNMLVKIQDKDRYKEKAAMLIETMKRNLAEGNNLLHAVNTYEVMLCR